MTDKKSTNSQVRCWAWSTPYWAIVICEQAVTQNVNL